MVMLLILHHPIEAKEVIRLKKRGSIIALLLVTALLVCSAAMAATVTASGKQTRGYGGSNAKLEAAPVTLPSTATITNVSFSGNGFWINDGYGNWIVSFYTVNEAKGYQLPAGTYAVYPNLKDGQSSAGVTVTFTY